MTQTPQHPPMTYEHLKQSHDEWRMLAMHNYGVAKAAEAREQQLKEAVQLAVNDLGLWGDKITAANVVLGQLQRTLSTLYPDTPAPKEQTDWLNEESCARCGRNKPVEGYEWCSECRPDLEAKDDGSLVQCPKCKNRNLIPHPSQANIWLCGPCNQVIEEGTDVNVD